MLGAPFRRIVVDNVRRPGKNGWRNFPDRAMSWGARKAIAAMGWEFPHALGPAAPLYALARRMPADLTIVHLELPSWIGAQLSRAGRRVAADFEDWYSEDLHEEARRMRPIGLLRKAEFTLMQNAAYVSTTSEAMADALHSRYGGRRPIVVRNCFPVQPLPNPAEHDVTRVIWFSQTIGPGRGLEEFLAAWGRTTQRSEVHLLGKVGMAYKTHLLGLVREEQRARIKWLNPVPPGTLPALLSKYDLGLALEMRECLSRDLTICNKVFQYLDAGLGVIATATAGQLEVLKQAPAAFFEFRPAPPEVSSQQLDLLFADRQQIRHMKQAARLSAETQFCWELEAPKLLKAVSDALTPG